MSTDHSDRDIDARLLRARLMTVEDVDSFAALRREGLIDSPHAFVSSPGDDRIEDLEQLIADIAAPERYVVALAFLDSDPERPVACAGLRREARLKVLHRASVWGVYCTPSARRMGAARACMELLLETARRWDGVEVVGLSASADATGAVALYQQLGFGIWGTEPDALRVGGRSYDEVYMQRGL